MAHGTNTFTTQRIIRLEERSDDHSNEASYKFNHASAIRHDGMYWAACRDAQDHGRFHLRHMNEDWTKEFLKLTTSEPQSYLYRPPHPSMTAEDIEGATYAYDDGTYWQFAHCSPDEQIDFAADAEAYTRAELDQAIHEANVALSMATNAAARTPAKAKVDSLIEFAELAGRRAHALVVGQTLGHYHRDPHNDHLREIALACIDAQLLDWIARASRDDDTLRVQAAVNAVKTKLASTHDIEWRWEREKRLNDAAAARGEDPVGGFEYCYVLSQTASEITGDSNLPDPTWAFDRLRTGTIGRGLFVYSDAEPKTNSLLSWVVRFKRPIPEGTVAGADIGSVAWTQEAAYQPS